MRRAGSRVPTFAAAGFVAAFAVARAAGFPRTALAAGAGCPARLRSGRWSRDRGLLGRLGTGAGPGLRAARTARPRVRAPPRPSRRASAAARARPQPAPRREPPRGRRLGCRLGGRLGRRCLGCWSLDRRAGIFGCELEVLDVLEGGGVLIRQPRRLVAGSGGERCAGEEERRERGSQSEARCGLAGGGGRGGRRVIGRGRRPPPASYSQSSGLRRTPRAPLRPAGRAEEVPS